MPSFATIAASVIFLATYVIVAIGKIPVYRIDRAGAALLGGSLMVGLGILSADEAYQAISFDTLTLLLGMMIVAANLRVSGFFRLVTYWVTQHVRRPLALLAGVVIVCGAFSAVLVNDTVCLVMTPLVLDVVLRLKRNPMPYLLAIAMGSNIGSVATITGNPQNMIVASLSQMPYAAFAAALAPVAALGLVLTVLLVAIGYRREFFSGERFASESRPPRYHAKLTTKTVLVVAVMVALFFLGQPVAKVAIVGGAFLLFTRRVNPGKIYREIDWPLLVMFAGLFIVVAGFEKAIVTPELAADIGRLHLDNAASLTAVTAVLSNLVSNVPAVLVLRPFVANLADPQRAWLIVAMASTLAGNFTLVGSVANLIVAYRAANRGIRIGFWEYFKVGAPLTLATLLIGLAWL
ncbi:MAG: anion transporter [Hyphomicrobiales bacterium]|nr:anion transporter [Hyphomicrobiales bacterium]